MLLCSGLQYCGWRWHLKDSRCKRIPLAALQVQLIQKWSLILPSSARVSKLTYVTIIETRYPELDNVQNDIIQFGNYLQAEQCTRGGFIPIFWDAPYSYIQASTDIGEVVDWITDKFLVHNKGDVLHNRNKIVNTFTNTEWVSGSGGAIISRSVTSCAGMTAFLVLLAQTKVSSTRTSFPKEEAYARAPAGAQQICFIMGLFFLLLAAKVRSSCEEGSGQSPSQSAYHNPQLDATEWKQHRTT